MKKRQIGMLMCAVLATAALAGCESASGEGRTRGTVTKEDDGHYSADITLYDGQKWGGVTLYYDPDSEGPMYMNLSTDYGTFWFYKAD